MFAQWKRDLPASLVVFLVAVPLCLGIALASGAPPLAGLIAGIIGGLVVGAASGSALGVSGPAAGLTAIVLTAIHDLGSYELVLTAVVVAGLMQVALGYAHAGIIAYYFPNSVIKGMLSGIGLIIILKQLPHAVGYDKDFEGDEAFLQPDRQNTLSELLNLSSAFTPGAVLVGVACLLVLILWESRWLKRMKVLSLIPGPLVAVVLGIVLGGFQDGFGEHGLSAEHYVQLPDLRVGLTAFNFPDLNGLALPQLWLTAATLAIVASLETLLSVEAADRLDPLKRITPTDRELKAQGIGNILSGLIGGLPLTQVIVRTSANVHSGGRTKLSTITHGALILHSLLLIPDLLELIPLASLAAVLIMVGYKLTTPKVFTDLWRQGWPQFAPFVVTVVGVVFTDLLKGVLLGMVVAVMHILWKNYKTAYHVERHRYKPGMPIYLELSEDVTFLNKAAIIRTFAELPDGARVVIDASRTMDIDHDVREVIDEFVSAAPQRGIRVELSGFKGHLAGLDHGAATKSPVGAQ